MTKKEKHRIYMREWCRKNRERARQLQRESYARNSEARKAAAKAYREQMMATNPEAYRAVKRAWKAKNRERVRALSREYYARNAERVRERTRSPEYRAKVADRNRVRREVDPSFRLKKALGRRMWHALNGKLKADTSLALLGCSVEQFKAHLEAHFQPGMTWANRGRYGWHVDHIKPCASFDLSVPEQQRQCFHYTNLQPLWAADNRAKWHRSAA